MAIELLQWYIAENVVWGYVSRHPKLPEGAWIHTSRIIDAEEDVKNQCLMVKTYSGSLYRLAKKDISTEHLESTSQCLIKLGLPKFCRNVEKVKSGAENERKILIEEQLSQNELFLEMIGCSCLGAYFRNTSGVHTLNVRTHVGMVQDSIFCTEAGIADFRYFPDNAGLPGIRTYHASSNIEGLLVQNLGCVDIHLNDIVCKAKAVTKLEKGCFSEKGLVSPDAYDGKSVLSDWMKE